MVLGRMHPGAEPADVLPAAVDAARAHTAVEAATIDVVRGAARITVRFEAADDLSAAGVGREVVRGAEALVEVEVSRVTRRYGARWYPFR